MKRNIFSAALQLGVEPTARTNAGVGVEEEKPIHLLELLPWQIDYPLHFRQLLLALIDFLGKAIPGCEGIYINCVVDCAFHLSCGGDFSKPSLVPFSADKIMY